MWTPWGPSQHQARIAEGITQVSTAGHGGIKLSPKRQQELQQKFPHFQAWAGGSWYEEDCDVCVVILAFPEEFSNLAIRGAIKTAHSNNDDGNWLPISQWLNSDVGEANELNAKVLQVETENADKWESGSMGSCKEGWNVSFTRVRDKESKWVKLAKYPSKQFYSDAELAEMEV